MSMIERSPKPVVFQLTEAQMQQRDRLKLERDDSYARFTQARNSLENLYQEIAGKEVDWELSDNQLFLLSYPRKTR